MIVAVYLDTEDECQIVHTLAQIREKRGNMMPRFSTSLEFPGAGNQTVRRVEKAFNFATDTGHQGQSLTRKSFQLRLIVKSV